MFASDQVRDLVGRQFEDLIDQAERDGMRDRVRQTMQGARMHLSGIRMTRLDGSPLYADATLGEIDWDGAPAVQILLLPAAHRSRGA